MSLLRLRPAGVRSRLAGEAPFPRPDHGGAPALEADFTVDRRDAVADRAVGEAKLLGDLLVGESSGDQAEDLPFAGREVVEPRQCPARPLRMAQIGELLHDGAAEPGRIAHDASMASTSSASDRLRSVMSCTTHKRQSWPLMLTVSAETRPSSASPCFGRNSISNPRTLPLFFKNASRSRRAAEGCQSPRSGIVCPIASSAI